MEGMDEVVRLAAVGDIHCTKSSQGVLQPLFAAVAEQADVLILCGDLTDYGQPDEAHVLVRELSAVSVPVVAVLGNHDFESGQQAAVTEILCASGVQMLDGDACEVKGVGFAGVKGFGGGFGARALGPWGEDVIKAFVREAVDEALKLESALARLRVEQKVAVMHYSPVQATVEGEPEAIFPFLGSSRLEEPLNRYQVSAVFHGHAHHGSPEGQTQTGIPVYNVSLPLLRQHNQNTPGFRVIELPSGADRAAAERPDLAHATNGAARPQVAAPA